MDLGPKSIQAVRVPTPCFKYCTRSCGAHLLIDQPMKRDWINARFTAQSIATHKPVKKGNFTTSHRIYCFQWPSLQSRTHFFLVHLYFCAYVVWKRQYIYTSCSCSLTEKSSVVVGFVVCVTISDKRNGIICAKNDQSVGLSGTFLSPECTKRCVIFWTFWTQEPWNFSWCVLTKTVLTFCFDKPKHRQVGGTRGLKAAEKGAEAGKMRVSLLHSSCLHAHGA